MSPKQFVTFWYTGVAIVVAIVGVVAALLLAIIATARSILANAQKALNVANDIVTTTNPIWKLDQTNAVAIQLLEEAREIEQHATNIADALESPQPR